MGESNRERFERVWRDHGGPISRTISSYSRPGADGQDLAQDVALALWRALPRFRGETSERAFVLRIAHNRGLNHLWRRRPTSGDVPDVADPAPPVEAKLGERQDAARLRVAIGGLPLGLRQTLMLALEDLSHAEIAAALGLTAENVAVRLSRARALLREKLKEHP